MLAYPIAAAQSCGLIDEVWVSTDDDEVIDLSRSLGAVVPFVRPASLSDDFTGTDAVIAHAVQFALDSGQRPTEVLCLYATTPLVRADDLRRAFAELSSPEVDFVAAVGRVETPPERLLRRDPDGRVHLRMPEHYLTRSQDLEPAFFDAGQFYWGRARSWLALGDRPFFDHRVKGFELPRHRLVDIDTPEDWARAESIYRALSTQT